MRVFYDPITLVTALGPALIGAVGGALNKPKTPKSPDVAAPDPKAVAAAESAAAREAAAKERAKLSARTGREAALGDLSLFASSSSGSTRRTLGAS